MFPEYRDLISRLKNENPRFMSLFDKHNKLDRKRAARTVLTGMYYSVGSATRQGSSSPTRFIGQSAMTSRT
ncbi:protein [Escherichia coli]|nr:protein [Escherichia coli]CTT57179.1 protein [Escherichia coli]